MSDGITLTSPARPLRDATSRFHEVVYAALRSGPPLVAGCGNPVVMVIAIDTWRRLTEPTPGFKAFLRSAPLEGVDLSRDGGDRPGIAVPS